jgi:hypothetical protein
MLEVCERFRMTIADYQALPPGERALYNQHTLIKLEAEAKRPPVFSFGTKGG